MRNIKMLLKNEFVSGKTWFDWAFLAVGLVLQVIAIIAGFIGGNPESIGLIISGLAGVISVILCSQGKISFYFFGFVQLFTYVFCFSIPNNLHGETLEGCYETQRCFLFPNRQVDNHQIFREWWHDNKIQLWR